MWRVNPPGFCHIYPWVNMAEYSTSVEWSWAFRHIFFLSAGNYITCRASIAEKVFRTLATLEQMIIYSPSWLLVNMFAASNKIYNGFQKWATLVTNSIQEHFSFHWQVCLQRNFYLLFFFFFFFLDNELEVIFLIGDFWMKQWYL